MNVEPEKDQTWLSAAKATLDQGLEELNAETLARLRAARRRALAEQPRKFPKLALAGGLATASVVILAGLLWLLVPNGTGPLPGHEDFELLTSAEGLEFYEDLEFYGWLADHERAS
ncbi:MAG: DUF3619 family protein [Nitrospiraceae bacterium]